MAVERAFTDPVSGRRVTLWVESGNEYMPVVAGVRHGDCSELATVHPELDAFYCDTCRWNGRVAGAWVHDVIREATAPPAVRCPGSGQPGHRVVCPPTHAFCPTCRRVLACPDPNNRMPDHDRLTAPTQSRDR